VQRRALGKAANEFVEKLFGADLEVERVAAVLDADVEELCGGELWVERGGAALPYIEREQGDVLVAMIDVVHDGHGCFSRPACWWLAADLVQTRVFAVRRALLLVD
jgi:hypothetical protein